MCIWNEYRYIYKYIKPPNEDTGMEEANLL